MVYSNFAELLPYFYPRQPLPFPAPTVTANIEWPKSFKGIPVWLRAV